MEAENNISIGGDIIIPFRTQSDTCNNDPYRVEGDRDAMRDYFVRPMCVLFR